MNGTLFATLSKEDVNFTPTVFAIVFWDGALNQATLSCWFDLVACGFGPLVLVEGKWEATP